MIGIHTLNVGGKVIAIKVSMWALRMTCKELETGLEVLLARLAPPKNVKDTEDIKDTEDTEDIKPNVNDTFDALDFIASIFANSANAAANGSSVNYTMRDGYEWIETMGIKSVEMELAMKATADAIGSIMGTDKATEPTANDDAKKNEFPSLILSN